MCGRKDERGVFIVDTLMEPSMTMQENGNDVAEDGAPANHRNSPSNKIISIYALSSQPLDNEINIVGKIGNDEIVFLADTGAAVSTINIRKARIRVSDLQKPRIALKASGGNLIKVIGLWRAMVTVGEQAAECEFYVVDEGKSLLGRDSLKKLKARIDCEKGTFEVNQVEAPRVEREIDKVFSGKLGLVRGFEHKVKRKDGCRPVQQKIRRLPLMVRESVRKEIARLEKEGVIESIEASGWISAMVVVAKKDGRVRLCVDLRAVNEAIVADVFPLPHFEDLLAELKGAEVFSKLDALSAYHQVSLATESRDLTAFITPWGLFRFQRVPFGLASVPAAFQRMMQRILEGIPGVVVYLDDILVHGKTIKEHDERLEMTLKRIRESGMTLNEKCIIRAPEIDFVGYSIGPNGIRPTVDNLRAIEALPEPTTITQIKSVLGTASFYMRCVPRFSTITEPIRRLLKSDTKFEWGSEQKEAFETMKREIVEAKPLALFDHEKEIVVSTDASNVGVGATLLPKHSDGERPVAFASSALNETQQRYSTGEKEALACVFAIERWHVFLYGRKFILRTDHQALVTLFGAKGTGRASLRIARWIERLRGYNFVVEYRPGSSNRVPDMLSRLPLEDKFTIAGDDEVVIAQLSTTVQPLSWDEIAAQTEADAELGLVRKWLRIKNPKVHRKEWASVIHELAEKDGVIFRQEKIVLPAELRLKAFKFAHDDAHQGMVRTKQRLRQIYWWPAMDRMAEEQIRECNICANSDRILKTNTAPIELTEWPTRAWDRLAVDIRGPDQTLGQQYQFALVVVDYYSKWSEVELLREVSTKQVVNMFRKLFAREGIPRCIVSDNGPQFLSSEFVEFMAEFGIKHQRAPIYSPISNGLVERFNRTLGGFLETAKRLGGDLSHRIAHMVGTYNATPQATTGKSPSELLHGRTMRTKLDVVGDFPDKASDDEVRKRVERQQEKQKKYADQRRAAKADELRVQDWVKIKKPQTRKGEAKFTSPRKILARKGKLVYETDDGKSWHRNQLASWKPTREPQPDRSVVKMESIKPRERCKNEDPVMWGDDTFSEDEEDSDQGNAVSVEEQSPDANRKETTEDSSDSDEQWKTPPKDQRERPKRERKKPDRYGEFV